jgi:hypothetical protein
MIDQEVARLRQLRSSALRVRAIARAFASTRWALHDPLLSRGACSSWRIARVVSGRLKRHPYARYQKDASIGCLIRNRVLASWLARSTRSRLRTLTVFESHLRRLARQLDDARALTWSTDLSDTFGRSQIEIKSLVATLAHETNGAADTERAPKRESPVNGSRVGDLVPRIEGDWPYLAF